MESLVQNWQVKATTTWGNISLVSYPRLTGLSGSINHVTVRTLSCQYRWSWLGRTCFVLIMVPAGGGMPSCWRWGKYKGSTLYEVQVPHARQLITSVAEHHHEVRA
jgi:hypothetical protein